MQQQIVTSNSVITNINCTNFLGVIIDSKLSWCSHKGQILCVTLCIIFIYDCYMYRFVFSTFSCITNVPHNARYASTRL